MERLTIFRSYGAILQSSFGIVFSIVLACNASPPVSVLGTVDNFYISRVKVCYRQGNRFLPPALTKTNAKSYTHQLRR